jgi:hypothetical protein
MAAGACVFRHHENRERGRVSDALTGKVVASESVTEIEASNGEISQCTVDLQMLGVSLMCAKARLEIHTVLVNIAFSLAPFPCQHTTQWVIATHRQHFYFLRTRTVKRNSKKWNVQ